MGYVYHSGAWLKAKFGDDVMNRLQSDPAAARRVSLCLHFGLIRWARRIVYRIPEQP